MRSGFLRICFLGLAAAASLSFTAEAAKPVPEGSSADAAIGLFEAQGAGQIDVKLIPKDSTAGTVVVTNKTQQPLSIKLPEAFAGVPVLGQRRGGAGGANGGNLNSAAGGGNQSLGGGFGGGGGLNGGGGIGGGGGGGGFFNVPAERAIKLKVVIVCLEHGKRDPSPQVAYDMVPIESYTKDEKLIELMKVFGRGEVDQRAAQAAAWHLANGLSWQELAEKIGAKHISGATEPYFSTAELQRARQLAKEAADRAIPGEPKL